MKKYIRLLVIAILTCLMATLSITAMGCGEKTYKITLDAAGGTVSESTLNVKEGASYELPTPSKTGYEFDGWYNGNSKVESTGKWKTKKNVTLVAHWNAKTYSLTLNANGGICLDEDGNTINGFDVTYGEEYTLPEPTKDYNTFDGWVYGEGDDAIVVESEGTAWEIDADSITLVASWSVNTVTINFDLDGGELVGDLEGEEVATPEYNSIFEMPNAVKEHYTFLHWEDVDNAGVTYIAGFELLIDFEEELNLKAIYETATYTVTLDADGGEGLTGDTLSGEYNTTVELPESLTKFGYTFCGWMLDEELVDNTYTLVANVTLVAKWEPKEVTLTLQANGGSGLDENTKKVYYGQEYELPELTKNGYTFNGWVDEAKKVLISATGDAWTYSDGNVVLKANFKGAQTTVTLNTDGGSGVDATITCYEGAFTELPEPTKLGSKFTGWKVDGTETVYQRNVPVLEWAFNSNVTLVAQWEVGWYKVMFYVEGASMTEINDNVNQATETELTLVKVNQVPAYYLKEFTLGAAYDITDYIPKYTHNQFIFEKWQIKIDGELVDLTDDLFALDGNWPDESDVELHAVFVENGDWTDRV